MVENPDISKAEGFNILFDFKINSSQEEVYNAITQPKHLINWWPKRCSGYPTVGKEYNFFFTEEYNWYAQVTMAITNERFELKMTDADEDWIQTKFGFKLIESKGFTKVSFYHTGWPACNAHFRKSSFSWAILLDGLRQYVEKGIVVPFEERE